jgi:hypothetical protein
MANSFKNMNCENSIEPDVVDLKSKIKNMKLSIDQCYNENFGSIFRNGVFESSFYSQVKNYADLYSSTHLVFFILLTF